MNISKTNNPITNPDIPDDYEVLSQLLEYAMVEAERHGEAYCAALISRAIDALTNQSCDLRNTPIPYDVGSTHLS